MTNNLDLQKIRRALKQERSQLLERIRDQEMKLHSRDETNPDMLDLAQDYALRERRSVRLTQARSQLEAVETALKRLGEGTYGICVRCGEAIAPGRLEVLPYASLCVKCQEREESMAIGASGTNAS